MTALSELDSRVREAKTSTKDRAALAELTSLSDAIWFYKLSYGCRILLAKNQQEKLTKGSVPGRIRGDLQNLSFKRKRKPRRFS